MSVHTADIDALIAKMREAISDEWMRPEQLPRINRAVGANYTSRGHLTEEHAQQVIARLRMLPDKPADTADPNGGSRDRAHRRD